ncbi:MAG TPA: helix-turn-helix transcriptional regulator [Candidatus Fimenecus stercoravium]|nr:helix-turn-helix transcriptional regulator [Candidatus Fimenecus stercoravium]
MMKNPELARQMRALRTVNHYTQQQIADILNIDRTTYTSYEISKNTPDVMLLDAFAKIFSVDIDFILHIDTQNIDTLCDEVEAYEANNDDCSLVSKLSKEERELIGEYRILSEKDKRKVRKTIASCNSFKKEQ